MKQYYSFLLAGLIELFSISAVMHCIAQQIITPAAANGDCSKAIEIKDSVIIATVSPKGFGNNLEIAGNKKDDIHFFEQEHNTVWYWFKVKVNAELTFEIIPQDINDDYDFALYRFTDRDFCADVKSKKVLPVRTCISRNDKSEKSITGLRTNAKEEFIHSGVGSSFAKPLAVTKGEIYFLIVDNVYPNGKGHTIHLHFKMKEEPAVNVQKDTMVKAPSKEIILEAGNSFTFSNIQFYGDEDVFLPSAKPALDSLLTIMKENATLKIDIQGHVNGPFMTNTAWLKQLSEMRAKAVFDFLTRNNIPAARMEHHGFGNTRMLFPQAIIEKEQQQNRRVEIKVLSK